MTGMLRDLLNERADAAGSPDLDLHELISLGERRVSRRRGVVMGGTVAAVVLTVGASFALVQASDRTAPPVSPPATTTPTGTVDVQPDTTDRARPLTYGLDGTIHYGDRVIETAEDAASSTPSEATTDGLFVFDDGLAILIGGDGREDRLYFTDGDSDPVEIARGVEMLTVGEVGSLMVWLDGDDVVIYDIHLQAVVARVPLNGRLLINPITPLEDAVYWHEYREDTDTTDGRDYLVRYDVQTGTRAPASEADYQAETWTAISPVLVMGSADSTVPAENFTVVDSQIGVETSSELGAGGPAFVAATGERLRLSVPDGYDGQSLGIFQWLDDDRFALVADGGVKNAPIGDLLTCRISAGQCRTIATGEQDWLLPGNDGALR